MELDRFILWFLNYTPKVLRRIVRDNFGLTNWDERRYREKNEYIHLGDEKVFEQSDITVGIVHNSRQSHKYWVGACVNKKVSFRIIHLDRSDWLEQVLDSAIDALLIWPDISSQEIKTMQDERLRIINDSLGIYMYPSIKEIELYENKRLQSYWLKAHGFPQADTRVFYDIHEMKTYLDTVNYPVVFKSNLGASASGVYIVRSSKQAHRLMKTFFRHGYKLRKKGGGVRQRGGVYVQNYLEGAKEWRMVRIGDSYFGHGKEMNGQFHSGSGKANWELPPETAFEMLRAVTDKEAFTSMDVDMFETKDGKILINELQTVFGNSIAKEQLKLDGEPGRFFVGDSGRLIFESGSFCSNHLCDLRLDFVIESIKSKS